MQSVLDIKSLDRKWCSILEKEFNEEYFKNLKFFLDRELRSKIIFPEIKNCFTAFNKTPLLEVKVVILGQDPYHGPGQAQGLSFSVPNGVKIPPSLRNIFKELQATFPNQIFKNSDLSPWAEQGVFLLNSVLTVEKAQAASHREKGWELFTDAVLKELDKQMRPIVFLLWGAYAQKKAYLLGNKNHLVLKAPHPSPLSAYRGFLGCGHFRLAQNFLIKKGVTPIKWGL